MQHLIGKLVQIMISAIISNHSFKTLNTGVPVCRNKWLILKMLTIPDKDFSLFLYQGDQIYFYYWCHLRSNLFEQDAVKCL